MRGGASARRTLTARSRLPACRPASCACSRSIRRPCRKARPARSGRRRHGHGDHRHHRRTRLRQGRRAAIRTGHGVAGARVGGGLSLTTTDANGHFTLPDVPLGQREIVAVSDALGSARGSTVDITRAGEQVPATIVLDSVGRVAGRSSVWTARPRCRAFRCICTSCRSKTARSKSSDRPPPTRTATIEMAAIPVGHYRLSAFTSDFSDGNLADVASSSTTRWSRPTSSSAAAAAGSPAPCSTTSSTPVKARVSLSGDQVVVAGGRVGVAFQYVQNFKIVDTDFSTGAFSHERLCGRAVSRFARPASSAPIRSASRRTMPSPPAHLDLTLKLQPTSQVTGQILKPRRHAGRRRRHREIQVGRIQDVLRRERLRWRDVVRHHSAGRSGSHRSLPTTDGTFLFRRRQRRQLHAHRF